MTALTYENTFTNLPGWVNTVHREQRFGYAYETDSHFVHLYGKEPLYIISVGLTVLEGKSGSLSDWILRRFGANDVRPMRLEVGHTVRGMWRPSLFFHDDTITAVGIDPSTVRA